MWYHRLSRRRFLALGRGALTAGILGSTHAQNEAVRIGVVLPTRTGQTPVRPETEEVAGEAALKGALMGEEDYGFNPTALTGKNFELLTSSAPDADAAFRAAERLAATEGVFALVGGFGKDQALALSTIAEDREVLFFNIGSPSDALRGEACTRYTFHIEASAAMYLDALSEWFVRAGFRRWFFVYSGSDEGKALYTRALSSLQERHLGASTVGKVEVPEGPIYGKAMEAIQHASPDVVLSLLGWRSHLDFLGHYEAAGLEFAITAFPYPVTQTREFFIASRNVAPQASSSRLVTLWEATLDAYGARELNERFFARWGVPMDPSAWAAYQAVTILFEATSTVRTSHAPTLVEYLESPRAVFDVHKGTDVSFRPWDHQLRQPLYLVEGNPTAERPWDMASLIDELPIKYAPNTDPIERLDQHGNLQRESRCQF